MARMSFDVPDNIGQRVVDGFAEKHGYQQTVIDDDGNEVPNPQSKFDFMADHLAQYIRDSVVDAETQQAQRAARDQARQRGRQDIVISVSR